TATRARQLGLAMALVFRIGLLVTLFWLIGLTAPLFTVAGQDLSWRDLVLLAGGAFLIFKATREIHTDVAGNHDEGAAAGPRAYIYVAMAFSALVEVLNVVARRNRKRKRPAS